MKYTELKQFINENSAGIYLLEGNDAYFRLNGEDMIKSKFLQFAELNYSSFEGETLKGSGISALVSACKNYPFMSEYRVIKVTEFYPSESDFSNYLKPLFDDFPPTTILIIVNAGGKKGVDLKRKKVVNYIDCNHPDPETTTKWIYVTLKRAKISASTSVCENIAGYCLCNMARVALEVQKIIDYKGGGTLTEEEADLLVFKDAEYRIYELNNTLPHRNYDKFVQISGEILKKGGDEMMILNGLFNYMRTLTTVLTSSKSDSALASQLNIKEFAVKKNRQQADMMGLNRLCYLSDYLYARISDVKCGRLTPPSALQAAQNAIFFG